MGLFRKSTDQRQPVSRFVLQAAITEAVKQFSPECRAFIDVILTTPPEKSKAKSEAADWVIRGVKFGRANRQKATEALDVVVARMAREFRLSEDSAPETAPPIQ
jgi:hypothetical protein